MATLAGIATGFWTEDWVLHHSDAGDTCTRFEPSISKEEADTRLARWDKAVQLSYNLSEQVPQ